MSDTQQIETIALLVNLPKTSNLKFGGKKKRGGAEGFALVEKVIVAIDLPEASIAFLYRYGLRQYIADGAAGAETQAEFEAGINTRLDNLASGEFARAKGERKEADTVESVAKRLARETFQAALVAAGVTLDKEAKAKAFEAFWTRDEADFKKKAEAELAERAEAAKGSNVADILKTLGL